MTLSGVTRRRKLWSGGISIAGSLRIETFEGSRPAFTAMGIGGINAVKSPIEETPPGGFCSGAVSERRVKNQGLENLPVPSSVRSG